MKKILAAVIAAMCFAGAVPVSAVPLTGLAEDTASEQAADKNETAKEGSLTDFGTGGEWSVPESSDIMLKNMDLYDVAELSKKGKNINWSDFADFNIDWYNTIAFSVFAKVDLGDDFFLVVGGEQSSRPDVVWLCYGDTETYVDVKTGNVKEFISENGKADIFTAAATTTTTVITTSAVTTTVTTAAPTGTKAMTLDDVKALAKKGGELTWSDFEAYSGRKCGTPFDMLAYIYEIDESYYLLVSGAVDGAPDKVQLCHYNEHISVDVLTGDVEAFIAEYSNYELPDIGYTFDEIYNMTEDEVRNVFKEKGLIDTEKYHVYPQRNGNTAVDNDSMTILLYPENYMINLTDHELVTHVTDMNNRDKLFKDSDIVWDREKVKKSLGLPEEYFNIYVESSMGVIKSAPEGEDPDIRKYCKCSIRCTSKDKDKIADLRRAALNYIQLNPDFALVYPETSGGENVSTPIESLKGDANCDGQVDMSDVVLVMQAMANPNKYGLDGTDENHLTEQGMKNADMDGNGLTVGDAQAIQMKLLGFTENEAPVIKLNTLIPEQGTDYVELKPDEPMVSCYDPVLNSLDGVGVWFELESQQSPVTLTADKGSFKVFTYKSGGLGTVDNVGKSYKLDKSGEVSWVPEILTIPDGYEEKIQITDSKNADLGTLVITKNPKSGEGVFCVTLKKPTSSANSDSLPALSDIVTIKTDYDPVMSDWSGIGILLEVNSPEYDITLEANDGQFVEWDTIKGSGPLKNEGKTYEIGKSGSIFWDPDDTCYTDGFVAEITVKGTTKEKQIELGKIYITHNDRLVFTASLEKPNSTTNTDSSAVAGKKFVYEKEGFGGDCYIDFKEDGTFLYSPGYLSSYLGGGTWEISGDKVVLTQENDGMSGKRVNYFSIAENELIYIEEGSDNFIGTIVKDGEKFFLQSSEE